MFRTALVRTVAARRAAAAVVVSPAAARTFVSRPVLRVNNANKVSSSSSAVAAAAWKVGSVRAYSAAGGLSKEDVEGRIVGLLAGFDKVSPLFFSLPPFLY